MSPKEAIVPVKVVQVKFEEVFLPLTILVQIYQLLFRSKKNVICQALNQPCVTHSLQCLRFLWKSKVIWREKPYHQIQQQREENSWKWLIMKITYWKNFMRSSKDKKHQTTKITIFELFQCQHVQLWRRMGLQGVRTTVLQLSRDFYYIFQKKR